MGKLHPLKRIRAFFHTYNQKIHANKLSFPIYTIMSIITIAVIVLAAINGQYESVFTASLTLILFLLPTFVEESLHIKLPIALEIIAILFALCANILGEIFEYYTRFPFWDDMLHYTSGFIFAAFGFALADIFNRHRKVRFDLSPFFLSFVALCFAVTVGVVWEFFEFAADTVLHTDMQKDTIVAGFSSALMNPDGQTPVNIRDVVQTVITTADGTVYTVEGYLDIGLLDTIKDLFVDFTGALLFAVIGFFYAGHSEKGHIAKQFIPQVESDYDDPSPPAELSVPEEDFAKK